MPVIHHKPMLTLWRSAGLVKTPCMKSLAVFLALYPMVAMAQLSEGVLEEVYRELAGHGNLLFTRLSSQGQFQGCELTFNTAVRDWRARDGQLVNVAGSISSFYQKGKAFNVNLKMYGEDFTISPAGSISKNQFRPVSGGLRLNGVTYTTSAAHAVFECEPSAICIGFSDPGFRLMENLLQSLGEGSIEILFTRRNGGMDLVIKPAAIKPEERSFPEYMKYLECYSEFLGKFKEQLSE